MAWLEGVESKNAKIRAELHGAPSDKAAELSTENVKQENRITQLEDGPSRLREDLESSPKNGKKAVLEIDSLQDENTRLKWIIEELGKENAAGAKDENLKLMQGILQLEGDLVWSYNPQWRRREGQIIKRVRRDEGSGYSTNEAKRKREDEVDIFKKCKISRLQVKGVKRFVSEMKEIKGMIAVIMSELREIRKENKEFKDEMLQMKRENDELKQEVNSIRSRVGHLYALEEKMEKLDRQAR
nr:unnamed protein product [Callosobruchus analis]